MLISRLTNENWTDQYILRFDSQMNGMVFVLLQHICHIYSDKSDIQSLCFPNFKISEDEGISIFPRSLSLCKQ